jgi:hypothetical protein
LAIAFSSALGQSAPIHFHNANKEAGLSVPGTKAPAEMKYIVQQMAGGVALFDCDNDGRLDIAVVTPSTIDGYKAGGDLMVALYHQDSGFKFTDVTKASGLSRKGWGMGVAVADFDNDGCRPIRNRLRGNVSITTWATN